MSRTNSSMKARFSSSTRISSSPPAKRRTISGSTGHTIPSRSSRIPKRRSASSSRPRSPRAWRSSWNVRPAAHDPESGGPGGAADLVEPVGRGVGHRRLQAPVGDVLLLLEAQRRDQARPLDVAPRLAVDLQFGIDGNDPVGAHLGDAEPVGDGGDHLERGPQARIPGQGDAVQSEVDDLLHRAGVQHRDLGVVEGGLHLGGQRRRLGHGVVAGQHQHPAVGGGALEVGVLEHVAAAVHARPLAVPHAHHAVVAGERAEQRLLAAPTPRWPPAPRSRRAPTPRRGPPSGPCCARW